MQDMTSIGSGALVDIVSDFYGASMDPRFWPTALMKLCEAVDATACALAWHDFSLGMGGLEQSIGIDVESVRTYGEYYVAQNPWLQNEEFFQTPGTASADNDLVSDETAPTSEFALHWLQPQGLNHQMFGVLERQGSRVQFLVLARPAAQGPFGSEAVGLMQRLLPYLQRGLRAGQTLRRSQHIRQIALDALDAMPVGVILLSAGGIVIAANRVAREIMASRDVLTVGRGGLEVDREGRRTRFRDLLTESIGVADTNRQPEMITFSVSRSANLRPLSVMIWPTRNRISVSTPLPPSSSLATRTTRPRLMKPGSVNSTASPPPNPVSPPTWRADTASMKSPKCSASPTKPSEST